MDDADRAQLQEEQHLAAALERAASMARQALGHHPTSRPWRPWMQKRRKLSKRERWLVYDASGGRCAICGVELHLDGEWHADHIIPFSETGSMLLSELQATCPQCNLKKRQDHGLHPKDIYPCYAGIGKKATDS